MTPAQLKKVVTDHQRFLDIPNRAKVTYSCDFIEDLLREELEYLKKNVPRAFVSIRELETAINVVVSLGYSIDEMETDELVKERIWN